VGLERHEDALKDRNRAVGLAPDDVDLLAQRAQTLRKLKRFDAAQKDLEKAISLNPGQAWLYYELGYVFFDQEVYPQARIFFDIAVQRDTAKPEFINMRGLANLRMEQWRRTASIFVCRPTTHLATTSGPMCTRRWGKMIWRVPIGRKRSSSRRKNKQADSLAGSRRIEDAECFQRGDDGKRGKEHSTGDQAAADEPAGTNFARQQNHVHSQHMEAAET
jgi:tetratricopeptide (TPR) repeat protein